MQTIEKVLPSRRVRHTTKRNEIGAGDCAVTFLFHAGCPGRAAPDRQLGKIIALATIDKSSRGA